jgi:PKD domain
MKAKQICGLKFKVQGSRFKVLSPRTSILDPLLSILILLLLAMVGSALATVRYVNVNNANPTPPYTNWATAATNIQDAVDAAGAGDEIVVTNGTYFPATVNIALTLQSVNGPQVTVINGGGAARCLYLTNNAVMVGFTLTNGVAGLGGGVYCESISAVLSNCVLTGNSGYLGGGAYGGTLNNCTLTANTADSGGGADGCTLNNCTLTGNNADSCYSAGGGADNCTLNNCTLTGNFAYWGGPDKCGFGNAIGGGAADSTLNNCTLTGNGAASGGGANSCTLNNCTLTGNSGGGASGGTLNNCMLTGNSGGGAIECTLNNCTLTGNSGGGAYGCTLNNCIVYFNSDPNGGNYDPSSTLNYCCTTPMPPNGVGNISADPELASASHLSAQSPCIGAGSAKYASGTDIDGEAWANPPSIGCDEYHAGAVTGPLTVSLTATYTNVATGFPVGLTASIAGRTDLSVWDFGDGDVAVNEPYTSHTWTAPGDYLVALWAFNDSYPEGVSATVTVRVLDHPVQYVAMGSTNPVAPYLSWATAATNIQDAVDARVGGRQLVLVTNGVYAPVTVDTPLTLQSVNGPGVTVINGRRAQECLSLANDTGMVGFTLTNGVATYGDGGGVYCESTNAVLSNCVLTGNSGSGAVYCTLNNCVLTGNSGGGANSCTLNNCVVSGNTGGGAYGGTLNNCTVTGNSGGAWSDTLNNCIVYFNDGGNYGPSSTLNYCCTTPMPTNGVGNISADPQLASASHLSAESPCIGAGSATYASGTDIDGEAWGNPPSIGCDEYHAGAVTGPLTVSLTATYTNVVTGFPVSLTAFIAGRTDLSVWDFGDGYVEVNEPYTSHAWTALGDYLVALWAFNDSYPGGVSATLTVHVEEGPHYVAATSGNPVAPYTNWATAATNIQDAVDVAGAGGTVFVTNGIYAPVEVNKPLVFRSVNGPDVTVIDGGGAVRCVYLTRDAVMVGFTLTHGVAGAGGGVYCESTSSVLTNCVLTGNSGGGAYGGTLNNCTLTGNSAIGYADMGGGAEDCTLNNCALTGNSAYDGGGASFCTLNQCTLTGNSAVNVGGGTDDSTLNNCTLTGNSATSEYFGGGGAIDCTLNNCTLTGNSASEGGGGADSSTLNNCTLTGNSAEYGGGVFDGILNNCTLTGNSAYEGGGAFDSTLNNCIVYFNTAANGANYYQDQYIGGILTYCCTTPMPTTGVGNITNAPLFVNYAGGNLRLQSNSPCINSGNNAYVVGSTDLDGHPRIVFGTVDTGAYEYQTPTSIISYAWLQQYGLPTDGSADHADLDGTGMNVYQDWVAGLNPTNALSVLKMLAPVKTNNPAGLVVTWQSVNTRTYYLQRSTNLGAQPAFSTIQSNIVGQIGTTSYTDTTATNAGPYFYRVGVGQ